MNKTYYTIYKVTNKINGKFYIGSHKTRNLDDNYMGSGKYLGHAINKHGMDNFKKEILHVFDNPDDMYAKEAEIVNEDFLAEENTYNLKVGGFGGWDFVNKNGNNGSTKGVERRKQLFSDEEWMCGYNEKRELGYRKYIESGAASNKVSAGLKRVNFNHATFKGRSHTTETKRLIGEKASINQKGERNSQFGSVWITNGKNNKKIKKCDPIPENWYLGRVIKNTQQ